MQLRKRTTWFHEDATHLGAANTLSAAIANAERRHPGIIPNLRAHQTILIGSDYSGSHQGAQFDITSFLVTNLETIGAWNRRRTQVRERQLPQNRHMSYKALNDYHRKAALLPFLDAANEITGLLISIALDRNVTSFFEHVAEEHSATYAAFAGWKAEPIERALRVMHFASLILRGISTTGQDVWWFTDQDDIVANEQRLTSFVSIMATISSHYLPHTLRHLRIGTTTCDTESRDLEDYVAIPDFAAGAIQELLGTGGVRLLLDAPALFLPRSQAVVPKARSIMDWFADNTQPLRRLTFVIDEPVQGKPRITTLRTHGSRDADAQRLTPISFP